MPLMVAALPPFHPGATVHGGGRKPGTHAVAEAGGGGGVLDEPAGERRGVPGRPLRLLSRGPLQLLVHLGRVLHAHPQPDSA